jgi:hypothetical protein
LLPVFFRQGLTALHQMTVIFSAAFDPLFPLPDRRDQPLVIGFDLAGVFSQCLF